MSNERKEKGDMSEWNHDTTGIEIGQSVLAYVETDTYESATMIKKIAKEIYVDMFGLGIRYEETEIIAWMPLPDPPKKKHQCQGISVICESFLGGLLVSGKNFHGDFAFPVTFCPFCGEKAND